MAVPPSPPRIGQIKSAEDAAAAVAALLRWAWDFYKAVILEQEFLQLAGQFDISVFDPSSLPDPSDTTIAKAQQTANEAFTLAAIALANAATAQTAADAAQTDATQALSDAAAAQTDATQALADAATAQTAADLANTKLIEHGQVTISGTATTGDFTFTSAEPDTTYFVGATPVADSGTPAAGSKDISTVTKATDKFTLNLATAPGAGNSVTFDVQALRNS